MEDLRQAIQEILERQLEGYSREEAKDWIEDLKWEGCTSGMVTDLIYYSDTCKFFEVHQAALFALCEEYLFRPDVVELGITGVMNDIAWFGFEILAPEVFEQTIMNYMKGEE